MPNKPFELGDYVEVRDRIRLFYEAYPDGRLTTADVTIHTDPDGEQRVMVKALAYRTPDDPVPGAGHSWMVLPGSTPYTRGSEVENTETSAWGRAIGSLGIGIDKSIASGDEVRGKAGEGTRESRKDPANETLDLLGRVDVRGKATAGGSERYKGDWRETPDGLAIGFALKRNGDKDIPQVLVVGDIAKALRVAQPDVLGTDVRVKGRLYAVKVPGRTTYNRLIVGEADGHFVETAEWRIPPAEDDLPPEPVAPGQETFDLSASMALDAEEAAV